VAEVKKNPPYKTLFFISLGVTLVSIALALLTGWGIGWIALAMLGAIFTFIMLGKLPSRTDRPAPSRGRTILFGVIGILILVALVGLLMPESFLQTSLFIAFCTVLGVGVMLLNTWMAKNESASTIGGWFMAVIMAGVFIFIFVGGGLIQTAVNLEIERKLEPKVTQVEGAQPQGSALVAEIKSFSDEQIVLRPGDTMAMVADASGIEVGYPVTIGTVTDAEGNVYPSPHAEEVTVTAVDSAAKTFNWQEPIKHYHLSGEYIIKSRPNIVGIIGVIATLIIVIAGKFRLPEWLKSIIGWVLAFAFLLAFIYLAVVLIAEGGTAIILGAGAILAIVIAVLAWLRDRAVAKEMNL